MTTTTDHTEIRDSADDDVQSERRELAAFEAFAARAYALMIEDDTFPRVNVNRSIWDFKPLSGEES